MMEQKSLDDKGLTHMEKIKIERTSAPKPKCNANNVAFGTVFSDHMFMMNYKKGQGWHSPRIVPFAPIELSPAAAVLHYAPEIFEGLKAYRTPTGDIQLFRPTENIRRLNSSAERMCLPKIDEDIMMAAIKELVGIDREWVPAEPGTSLYIRPFMFASDARMGIHSPEECIFCIITCPVGSYFPEGINPVKMLIEKEDARAAKGGTGYAKCGGNYAASLRAGERAEKMGYSQVLWLDAAEKRYIEEGGGMNVMFKIDGKVITPALTGSVLDGITRKSLIEILRSWNVPVEERLISVDELLGAIKSGRLEECWCCGTAAVLSPIGELVYCDESYTVNSFKTGPMAQKLYDELTGIQWGRKKDSFGWVRPIV